MLADVLGAFLDAVTEREFDPPLIALLRAQGFTEVHHIHGAYEAGKDFIAQRPLDGRPTQYALQSKAGDLGLTEWRATKLQIDQIRTNGSGHPSFDRTLPRRGVLVLTGRLTGGAATDAQEYREYVETKSDFRFEAWDRERLIADLLQNPSLGLSGGVEGPLLTVLGKIDEHTITDRELEEFTRRWIGAPAGLARASLECAVIATRSRANGRIDQAAFVVLALLRAAWASGHAIEPAAPEVVTAAATARRLFAAYATELYDEIGDEHLTPDGLIDEHPEFPFPITYQVRALRLAEIVALYALLLRSDSDPRAAAVSERLVAFVRGQPGVAHPISDRFAVSFVPVVLALALNDRALAEATLRSAIKWTADHYEKSGPWGLGLAGVNAAPGEEIEQLLGGPLEHINRPRRQSSYIATIATDLAGLLGFGALYEGAVNEFLAVDADSIAYELEDTIAQYGGAGRGLISYPNVQYRTPWAAGGPLAAHHLPAAAYYVQRVSRPWDLLAISALLRDRHWTSAIAAVVGPAFEPVVAP